MTSSELNLASLTPAARRVLAAASDLFYERGIHAVGVDAISQRAGVTKKTLYDRFGSKDALVVSYLQLRDARWREHVGIALESMPEPGVDRILAVFDAAITWSDQNNTKGCSAINARAEVSDDDGAQSVFPEVTRQKVWQLELFARLCGEAGMAHPENTARALMLLYEGALVTVGMRTFTDPIIVARSVAAGLLTG